MNAKQAIPTGGEAPGTDAGHDSTPPPSRRKRLTSRLLLLILLAGALIGARIAQGAWRETCLREAYLPDLQAMAQREPYNGHLLALLGARLCQARQFAAAGPLFERAVAVGETNETIWLTWTAAAAAGEDRTKSWSILQYARRQPELATSIQAAIDRCRALPSDAPSVAVAQAIHPQGLQPILARYAAGSCLNGLSAWYGRRHPANSGFATREIWAREQAPNAQVQALWGEALLRNARSAEAVTVLKHALELTPGSLSTRLLLADALYQSGARGQAGLEYIACLKARPDWQPALLGMGHVAVDMKLIGIGIQVYEKAVKQDPKSAEAWIGLGRAYMNQRLNLGRALSAFQTAARLAPDRTDFYGEFSDALRVNYRAAEAEAILRKRLAAAPDEARTHYLLATTLLTTDPTPARLKEAEAELREALRLEPAGYASAAELGKLLMQQDRAAEAVPLLESALKADPHSVATTAALARAYKKVGRTADAKAAEASLADLSQYVNQFNILEEQIQRQPTNAKLYHELASTYASGGEMDKARLYEVEAVALERHGAKAGNAMNALRQATGSTIALPERPNAKTP